MALRLQEHAARRPRAVAGRAPGVRLREAGVLPLRRALTIARDTLVGLDAAHAAGVVHRDLKPDNIVLVRLGACVLDSLKAWKLLPFAGTEPVEIPLLWQGGEASAEVSGA